MAGEISSGAFQQSSTTTPGGSSGNSPQPSGSGASESSVLSWGSSSSSGCTVTIHCDDIFVDNRGSGAATAVIRLAVTGCSGHATGAIEITPLAPSPQNEVNSPLWTVMKDPVEPLTWNCVPTWYGSAPSNLCYGYAAPFRIDAVVSCPHCTCRASKNVLVRLPTTVDKVNIKAKGDNVYILDPSTGAEYVPSIGLYRCQIWAFDFEKVAELVINDHFSQYRTKIKVEENFHVTQWCSPYGDPASADRQKGGFGDLYTGKGFRYWLPYIGDGLYFVYGDTALQARQDALAQAQAALLTEINYSNGLFNTRRCFCELKAKQEAGYREAYTILCSYPLCTAFPNPTHIAWQ